MAPADREALSRDESPAVRKLHVVRAALGRQSGLIGAARHAMAHRPTRSHPPAPP
ncbi:hypothetical protein [Kitasatospora azatica]|uniref:hypothetical protein n=1 Tax=Kitasatospora azatica TaxID=58347 RepID=UPI0012F8EF5E|nr:hypothetical protein [Kitasatospora azatica]